MERIELIEPSCVEMHQKQRGDKMRGLVKSLKLSVDLVVVTLNHESAMIEKFFSCIFSSILKIFQPNHQQERNN